MNTEVSHSEADPSFLKIRFSGEDRLQGDTVKIIVLAITALT